MRLTARKAVEISRELWVWLAETGGDRKGDWSGWEKYGEMLNDCPLCEYAERHNPKDSLVCPTCPLLGRWEGVRFCFLSSSPFDDWCRAKSKNGHQPAAQRMVALFDKWLEEHKRVRRG